MTELLFSFQEMADEVDAFSRLADRFIDPVTRFVLHRMRSNLQEYRDQRTKGRFSWEISLDNPLRTVVSRGGYEKGLQGEHNVFAEITAKWEIERVPAKKGRCMHFKLVGVASTCVRLIREQSTTANAAELAMWKMEIGDAMSPGCHFHVHILGEAESAPFPSSLSVPRLPGLIMTPTAVAEFVLAELFQEDWPKHIASEPPELTRWAPIQQRRLTSLLSWKLEVLRAAAGSPWTTLKATKPPMNTFLTE